MLVSASAAAGSESVKPGLDPGGENIPGLVADTGLDPLRGLEPVEEKAEPPEGLEVGRLAELGLL